MDYNTPEKCARPPKMAETLHPCGEVEPFSLRGVLSTPKSPDLSPAEVLLKPLNAHASEFFPSQPTADAESWPRWWNWGAYEVWVLGFPALGLKVQEPGGGGAGGGPNPAHRQTAGVLLCLRERLAGTVPRRLEAPRPL